ncbi:MAG TPA: adenylate/guanylate cyclase domain-containing protein [Steroidobacteraceae bacterium]|nr:adenylate/guanylate cyclase domain-containing protein [Steroidobacteraceae bacterium]
MRWWTGRSLRTRIFVAFSVLIVAVLLATLGLTQLIVGRDAGRTLSRELRTTGQVFESLLRERATRLQTNSTLLASDFALKRVFATHFDPASYDSETLASAGLSYRQRIGVQLVWMTDETGKVLAASPGEERVGQPLADFAPLKQALANQAAATAVVEVDNELFQMVAVPVLGPDVIGFLMLGQAIDDRVASRLKEDTHSDVTFLTDSTVFASSWPTNDRGHPYSTATLTASLAEIQQHNPRLLTIGGERYLSLAIPVDAYLEQPLYVLIQGSYDRALVPLHTLQWRIAVIGTIALAGALLCGILLAGGITGPVRLLVNAMHEIPRGNLRHRIQIDRDDEIGFLSRSFNEMADGLEEREHIKDTFGRFVSRDVAEAVLSGQVPLAGERREVSILFQDIRGFTALSEKLDPVALLRLLNQFFTEVVAAVEAEGGVVKQFTGDGVMALFGAPQSRTDHTERAVRAALGIVSRLTQLNVLLQKEGLAPLLIGIGIHTGDVVAGLIGPDERIEYGVVGEPVNLASRIEALTKELAATILVSKEIAGRLGPQFVLGRTALLPVKGKSRPVEVVEVLTQQ